MCSGECGNYSYCTFTNDATTTTDAAAVNNDDHSCHYANSSRTQYNIKCIYYLM